MKTPLRGSRSGVGEVSHLGLNSARIYISGYIVLKQSKAVEGLIIADTDFAGADRAHSAIAKAY